MRTSVEFDAAETFARVGIGRDTCASDQGGIVAAQQRLGRAFAAAKLRPRQGESITAFLHRQTHVYLQHQGLIGSLHDSMAELVPKASVLYAYGNQLTDISALSRLTGLRMLYLQVQSGIQLKLQSFYCCAWCRLSTHDMLQDNRLATVTFLSPLTALQKLHVDGNCIEHVSGLDKLRVLSDLHISRQSLPDQGALTFDDATLRSLSNSLMTLRAASCGMTRISGMCFWQHMVIPLIRC